MFYGAQKGLLRHIFGIVLIPQNPEGNPIHTMRVPVRQDLESRKVTLLRQAHKISLRVFDMNRVGHGPKYRL
jgi:hypothetical protein